MHIVHVQIQVKTEHLDAFRAATIENARNSIQEPGIVRFDFLQSAEDAGQFLLIEVYHTPDDQARHRETKHYQAWRDTVADMMVVPRTAHKFVNIVPSDDQWR